MSHDYGNVRDCKAHVSPNLGYLNWFSDAEQRAKRGEVQRRCKLCGLWEWPDHYTDKSAMGDTPSMARKRQKDHPHV